MKTLIYSVFFLLAFLISNQVQAQSYESAIGVRANYGINATYKKQMGKSRYIDIYGGLGLGSGYSSFVGGAALEWHKEIEGVENLYYYYGGGAYLGSVHYNSTFTSSENYFYLGLNAVLGLDYAFDDLPLNISVDWMPGFNVVGGAGFYGRGGGFSIRYILK